MPVDVKRQVAEWRAEAVAGACVSREICTEAGELLNYHARLIPRPLDEVYRRLTMMVGGLDDCWPLPSVPMKADGPFAVGVQAGHGPIRYELAAVDPAASIEWRFVMERLFDRLAEAPAPWFDPTKIVEIR